MKTVPPGYAHLSQPSKAVAKGRKTKVAQKAAAKGKTPSHSGVGAVGPKRG